MLNHCNIQSSRNNNNPKEKRDGKKLKKIKDNKLYSFLSATSYRILSITTMFLYIFARIERKHIISISDPNDFTWIMMHKFKPNQQDLVPCSLAPFLELTPNHPSVLLYMKCISRFRLRVIFLIYFSFSSMVLFFSVRFETKLQ